MNCITLLAHILSLVTAFILLILIIYRLYTNIISKQHLNNRIPSLASPFNDNVSLILIGNTYFVLFLLNITWLSIICRTFIGDFFLLRNLINLGDSTFCRLQVGFIFVLTSKLYHSFLLQALSRFINIIYNPNMNTMNIPRIPTHSPYFYLLLVFLSWVISFLLTIPAYNIFHVFSYFPEQYHCMISFTNISGFTYSLFVCYVIPMGLILYMYSKVIKYVRKLPKRGLTLHTKREVMIIRSILKICFIITIPGLSTVFFLLQSIFQGSTHPLADRIHELCVAIGAFVLGFGFAILNSLLYVLPRQSISHETNPMIHLQEFN